MNPIYYLAALWFLVIVVLLILSVMYDVNGDKWAEEKRKKFAIIKTIFIFLINITFGLILLYIMYKSGNCHKLNMQYF